MNPTSSVRWDFFVGLEDVGGGEIGRTPISEGENELKLADRQYQRRKMS